MTATPTQARDDLYELVTTAWGDNGPIDYEDKPRSSDEDPIPPTEVTSWLRVQMRHTTGRQATLSNEIGSRRFRRTGVFTVQVFCPMGTSLRETEELSKLINDALEGMATPHGVLLRNVRMNEVGSSNGHWFQTNVIADFEYDEVK